MAKAAQPPKQSKSQKFYISNHAMERLRTRSEAAAYMNDDALARVLDDAVRQAICDEKCVEHTVDNKGEEARIVHLPPRYLDRSIIDGNIYVLVKEDTHNPDQQTVVTVLTREMKPKIDDKPPLRSVSKINDSLAGQLKGIKIQEAPPPDIKPLPATDTVERLYVVVVDGVLHSRGTKEEIIDVVRLIGKDAKVYKEVPVKINVEIE